MAFLRVLVLATRLPVPPWRGDQMRAYHHLRLLAGRHDVTLWAMPLRPPAPAQVEAVRGLGVRVHVLPLGLGGALAALAHGLVDATPLQVLLFRRRRAVAAVRALFARERFDVVHAQLVRTGAYWPDADGPPVVLDLIDALSENFARRAARERGVSKLVSTLEEGRLRRYERALVARAAATLVVAEPDRRALASPRVRVVPNGVDLQAFAFRPGGGVAGRIVFAGNLGYFPNVDAARWLVDEILPAVRRSVPDASVHLVGARPSRAVRTLARRPGVSLAAEVPAMAPEIASGAVTVIPMRSGSGMQNKVLEAMAVGTPVVTTSQVAAAFEARDGEHLVLGDTTEALAAGAVALLREPARARRLADAARSFVERGYGWESSADALEAAWRAACASA